MMSYLSNDIHDRVSLIEQVVNIPTYLCSMYCSVDINDELKRSILENGIVQPLICRPLGFEYQACFGIKRMLVARELGIERIPCIIRDLPNSVVDTLRAEERVYRLLQKNEKLSVVAKCVADYHSRIKAQGKRVDLIDSVRCLLSRVETFRPVGEKLDSGKKTAEVFRMSARSISRFLRVDLLNPILKNALDRGQVSLRSAVALSYLEQEIQEYVGLKICVDNYKVTEQVAEELRRGICLGKNDVDRILKTESKRTSFKQMPRVYRKYEMSRFSDREIEDIIDKALCMYFSKVDVVL